MTTTLGTSLRPHLRNRDYDPTTATFLSRDPAMEGPGGMYGSEPGTPTEANTYHYVAMIHSTMWTRWDSAGPPMSRSAGRGR
jgi:hypothetical protein